MTKDYIWSSYKYKIGQDTCAGLLDPDPLYIDLGKDDKERRKNYQKWFEESIPSQELDTIRRAINKGGVFGNSYFKERMEKLLGRRLDTRDRGQAQKGKRQKMNPSLLSR